MRSASHPPSRSSSRIKRRNRNNPDLPFGHIIAPPGVVRSRRAADQEWTWEEKLAYFRTLPPVLCPASPPPTFKPSETVEQARRRSRQRVERMTERLSKLPLYQARHLIHLVSTELKGPFSPGCKYWGTSIPELEPLSPEDLASIGTPIEKPIPYRPPRPMSVPQFEIEDAPRFSTPTAPGPSSTVITGPSTPFTPPSASQAPIDLLPVKGSAGRSIAPVDDDRQSPVRSPTPTPSLPRSRMGSHAGSRPPETPGSASQRSFIMNLQASRASSTRSRRSRTRSSRGLKILPPSSQAALDRLINRNRPESRDQSPLLRYSQREANGATARLSQATQLGETSKRESPAPLSQRESGETYTYNSEFSVERHIDEIGQFMEADING